MTNNTIKTLQALVEAGKLATQGEWVCGPVVNHKKPTTMDIGIEEEDGYTLLAELHAGDGAEAKFITQAANARPALKQLLDLIQAKNNTIKQLAEALNGAEKIIGDMNTGGVGDVYCDVREALQTHAKQIKEAQDG